MYTVCKWRASSGGTPAFRRVCYFLGVLRPEQESDRETRVCMSGNGTRARRKAAAIPTASAWEDMH